MGKALGKNSGDHKGGRGDKRAKTSPGYPKGPEGVAKTVASPNYPRSNFYGSKKRGM